MVTEVQKQELIRFILALQDPKILEKLVQLTHKYRPKSNAAMPPVHKNGSNVRQFGFAKGVFVYVAPDFDDTPPGFEEYMQAA